MGSNEFLSCMYFHLTMAVHSHKLTVSHLENIAGMARHFKLCTHDMDIVYSFMVSVHSGRFCMHRGNFQILSYHKFHLKESNNEMGKNVYFACIRFDDDNLLFSICSITTDL